MQVDTDSHVIIPGLSCLRSFYLAVGLKQWVSHGQPTLSRELCYLAVLTHLTVSTQWPSGVMVTETVDFQTINSLVLHRRCYLTPALMSMESVRLTRWFYSFQI